MITEFLKKYFPHFITNITKQIFQINFRKNIYIIILEEQKKVVKYSIHQKLCFFNQFRKYNWYIATETMGLAIH